MNSLMASWIHSGIPGDWARVRDQWEHGHAARAGLWTVALALDSFVRGPANEAPRRRQRRLRRSHSGTREPDREQSSKHVHVEALQRPP
jgi:hypothetical protein